MAGSKRVEYYDLKEEALPFLIGRREEVERVTRTIGRRLNNNVLIVGPNGIGKTAFAHGWVRHALQNPRYKEFEFLQFGTEHFDALSTDTDALREGLASLPDTVLVIDDLGRALARPQAATHMLRAYGDTLQNPRVRIIATMEPNEFAVLERENSALAALFEVIVLKQQTALEYQYILQAALATLNAEERILIPTRAVREVIKYVERFPALGTLPSAGIRLLDECISYTTSRGGRVLKEEAVAHVVASKLGLPKKHLSTNELQALGALEGALRARVVGQDEAIRSVVTTLQRARLGLRNPNRPLGSFLMLGPSGVGKTETAKLIAESLFGRPESFARFDMSEFQQEHMIQRLIGAPAGYIGYEEGGALTNTLRREPHTLVLLDEIEKAHPKVFDIFLQVLDDGRLTSGQNETVDARNSVVMATSNIGVDRILVGLREGKDVSSESFIQEEIIPALAQTFRLEFINRFDRIVVFNPLSIDALVAIALLEAKKTEARLAHHNVKFDLDPEVVRAHIETIYDPRFGARPIKRFIEETCESLLAESLLANSTQV